MKEVYVPVKIPIHEELHWKLQRMVKLFNETKQNDEKKTTYVTIINDCIAIGLRECIIRKKLDMEYEKS